MALELISPDFEDGDEIPVEYTADGENVNPPLQISDVPEEAETMVLIVDDPDAEEGAFVHWMVWNIDPTITSIAAGELPLDATEGYNDFGNMEYSGPCPTDNDVHSYQFRLYALDIELELDEDVTRAKLEKEMAGHIVDESVLMGTYKKR